MALDLCRREFLFQAAARSDQLSKQRLQEEELSSLRDQLQLVAEAAASACSQRIQEDQRCLRELASTRSTLLRLAADLHAVRAQNAELAVSAGHASRHRKEHVELRGEVDRLRRAVAEATASRDRLQEQVVELEEKAASRNRLALAYEEGAQDLRTELRHALRHLQEGEEEHALVEESWGASSSGRSEVWEPLQEGAPMDGLWRRRVTSSSSSRPRRLGSAAPGDATWRFK
ncbi:serS [Symbiodinium natans]|uniref:SerS protein n=1 Tax=Symbiodinium natans TaxID=878477 RepID=A0A812SDK7_9DINO|nr:serS [Symbiodinium natans]